MISEDVKMIVILAMAFLFLRKPQEPPKPVEDDQDCLCGCGD